MSPQANSAPTPREVAFRAERNWHAAKSAQHDRHEDASRRVHIPTARFPTSFSAADGSLSEVRSRSAYYSVMARAVAKLPKNTRDARFALYDRAEIALGAELLRNPNISDDQVAIARLALERAILKIEGDARKREMSKQLQDRHRRPFTWFLSFFLSSLSVRFTAITRRSSSASRSPT
jgi:hypothetical protein